MAFTRLGITVARVVESSPASSQPPIDGVIDAKICPGCGNPILPAEDRPLVPDENACPLCGGCLSTENPAKGPMDVDPEGVPIGRVCPNCGSDKYQVAKSRAVITYAPDRICKMCGVHYALPTPKWAAVVFVLVGVVSIAMFFLLTWNILQEVITEGGSFHRYRLAYEAPISLVIGILAVRRGVIMLRGKSPRKTATNATVRR